MSFKFEKHCRSQKSTNRSYTYLKLYAQEFGGKIKLAGLLEKHPLTQILAVTEELPHRYCTSSLLLKTYLTVTADVPHNYCTFSLLLHTLHITAYPLSSLSSAKILVIFETRENRGKNLCQVPWRQQFLRFYHSSVTKHILDFYEDANVLLKCFYLKLPFPKIRG